jgi:hypothetical protein
MLIMFKKILVKTKNYLIAIFLIAFSCQSLAAMTYDLSVTGMVSGDINSTIDGSGTGNLDGNLMTFSFTALLDITDEFLNGSVFADYFGIIDLDAVSGNITGSNCVFASGPDDLCDFIILGGPSDLFVVGVSAISGPSIVVTSHEDQGNGLVTDTIFTFTTSEVPVPAAAWLFGSALIGLAGIKRKK